MSTDEELLKQMALQKESPDDPTSRRAPKPQYARSKYNPTDLIEKYGERIWVRCIAENGPWADGQQLEFWKDYFITVADAIMLDERRFAVILITPDEEEEVEDDEEDDNEEEAEVVVTSRRSRKRNRR